MKRLIVMLMATALIGASTRPESNVTLRVHKAGCLLLKPDHPVTLTVAAFNSKNSGVLYDRAITLSQVVTLSLTPGYYWAAVGTPRCWPDRQNFVVGTGWDRSVVVEPGITLKPPQRGVEEIEVVDYARSSGLVLHTSPDISKVQVKAESETVYRDGKRSGDVWYFDYAGVGRAKITLYVGNVVTKVDHVVLQDRGFLERFYNRIPGH